jgi:hypothetical protein
MTAPLPGVGRLGRRFAGHDQRSRNYGVRELLPAVERKPTFWGLPDGPFPLDQGQTPACTGFGTAHELAAGPVMLLGMNNAYALLRYHRNQEEDQKMGNVFDGGATVLATMKAAQADGLITGYRWAFGVDDCVDTLCTTGPVCLGIDWLNNMFNTSPQGRVSVSGTLAGGHFIDLIAYDVHPLWGPAVAWVNSWGFSYGVAEPRLNLRKGIGWLTLKDLGTLLARDGEAVVPADFFPPPVPPPTVAPYFSGSARSRLFHDRHAGVQRVREFATYQDAVDAGLRPCRICRPQP